ncbi:hypothetical protein PACILC2_00790 [Paenibacillus cisolokensis]|uniref:NTP pyrophosphohydrolase MazG putative catalytic core domain-containing protein n=1 Tax=Paenibacillus cisolokensis TaxID=1658519 RepID=A0ABQ4N014_9BACL|nr:hypothetical protein [Paenibacillus cisolokensis]GIQ61511.1 hypothetical protein PACILC2_00790 [Paenibacillus cisolokensis]
MINKQAKLIDGQSLLKWLDVEIDLSSGNSEVEKADRWAFRQVKKAIHSGRFDATEESQAEVQRLREALGKVLQHEAVDISFNGIRIRDIIQEALSATTEPTETQRESLRSEVQWFAEQMEENLRENDHKGGWENESIYWLFSRLKEESTELLRAVDLVRDLHDDPKKIISEAADVANFAMMIADNARRINAPEKEEERHE